MPKLSLNASKKTKHTPAGEIPVDWAWGKLETVANIQTGLSKSSSRNGDSIRMPYLRVANVQDGYFSLDEIKEIDVPKAQVERFAVKKGDLLLTEGGDFDKLGRGAVWNGQIENCVHQNHLFVVRGIPTIIDQYFLASYTQSPKGRNYFQSCSKQSTNLASINSSQLKQLPIPLPPLPEQCRIGDILSTWDRAIETLESLIAAKSRRKRTLMQQLLTGKKRLPGFLDSWENVTLGSIFTERKERNRSGLRLLAITAKQGVVERNTLEKKDSSNEDKSKYLRIAPGDIGYNTMRMWQGVCGLSSLEGIISPAYTVLKPTPRIEGIFASFLFKLPDVIFLFWRHSQGLVDDTLMLKFPAFSKIHLNIPKSLKEQKAIASLLDVAEREITLHRQHLATLRKQKRCLMQKLLTGEVRT